MAKVDFEIYVWRLPNGEYRVYDLGQTFRPKNADRLLQVLCTTTNPALVQGRYRGNITVE